MLYGHCRYLAIPRNEVRRHVCDARKGMANEKIDNVNSEKDRITVGKLSCSQRGKKMQINT